jgi:hypothetical protein
MRVHMDRKWLDGNVVAFVGVQSLNRHRVRILKIVRVTSSERHRQSSKTDSRARSDDLRRHCPQFDRVDLAHTIKPTWQHGRMYLARRTGSGLGEIRGLIFLRALLRLIFHRML